MKLRLFMAFCVVLVASGVVAAELTRSVELSAENSGAVFAVPNGFSFTRAHATDAEGGSVPVSVGESTTMNHVTLVPVAVNGEKVKVTVVFTDDGELFTGRPAKVMRQAIKEKVANPEDVELVPRGVPARGILKLAVAPQSLDDEPSAQQIDGADVLILSPHDNVTLWENYAAFRKSTAAGAGLTFKVVDLDTVYATYPWNGDRPSSGVRNAAESIHKYLRENRDSLGFSYVILGGSWIDAQSLDSEGHWLNSSGARIMFPTGADMTLRNCVPSVIAHSKQDAAADMFYACLDLNGLTYPWCEGDSTEYFKVQDKIAMSAYDRGVDVIVSRLPLKPVRIGDKDWTSAELMDAFIEKLRRVEGTATEHNFIGTGRLGNLWHNLSDPYGNGISVDASLPHEHEFYDDVLNLFDEGRDALYNNGETPSRKMLREHVSKYYPMKEVDSVSPRAWTKGYATSDEAKTAYFAKDRDYGSMESHGYAYFAGSEGFVNTTTFYNSTGLTLLNDFTMLCATGQQNYIGERWQGYTHSIPCLGEAAVDAPFGGAIATLNNSRDGLTGGENSLSYRIYHEGARKFLHEGGNAGETWLASHLAYAETLGPTGEPGGNLVLVEHTLFGDPLVKSQAFADKDKAFESASYSVSGVEAYVDAKASGNLTLSGNGRIKVLQTLSIGGTSFKVEDGVEGGVGQKVAFTGAEKGAITINTTKRFYLGGVANCSKIVVNGSNVIVDCDNLGEGLSSITFNMTPDATCTLRGLKKGALAGINLVVNGGTLVFETSDVLNQNRVDLNGATLIVKVDPALGSGHPSAESMNGIFYGSGKLVCQRGTEALKKWSLQSSSIVIESFGEIEPTFEYSGVVGSSPSGWFNAWKGEAFDDNKSVLAPNGFVRVVENQHHPFAALPDREMITLALSADVSKVANANETVLLSIGNSNSDTSNQLLLTRGTDRKIRLYYTSPMGYYQRTTGIVVDDPGEGFHLYVIERTGSSLKLVVDGTEYVENDDVSSYKLEPYLQIGSQYWYLQNERAAADGMVVAALRGYDVIIDDNEMASLVREFPAAAYPLAITKTISFAQANEATATLANAVFAAEASLKVAKGRVDVPMGTTVTVPTLEFADGSSTDDRAVVAVAGTLNAREIVLNGRGTQTLDLCGGRLVATDDWKVSLPINVTADSTLDSNGHDLILSGSISGSANLTITGAGSVTILSDISNFSGKITVASSVAKFGVRREYVGSSKISFATRPATLIVALSAEQLQEAYTASPYAGYMKAGSTVVFTDYDGYVYQETTGTTLYAPWQSLTYRYDDIDWSYVYLPYERGKWEPLINWRSLSSNISETNSVQQFATGLAPQTTATCGRWESIVLNGAEFEGEKDADGFYNVRAGQLEGWNLKLGVYNGVHLTVGRQVKFQTDSEQYLRVGSNSRVTFESFGTGNSNNTLPIYVASTDGVVFKTDVPNISYSYHLAKNATVKFEQGLSRGTHTIAACEAALSDPTGKTKYNINAIKLFDFNGKGSSASITLGANALTLKNAAGGTVVARKFDNSLEMYKDAITNHRVGGYTLLPGDAGLYLAYIDYAETSPTEITISGLQTNLDLTSVPDGIRKIRLVNARGYFKNSTHKVETPVEFMDSASGRLAFEWTDGYSDKIVEFSHATGSGTIQSATKQGQMMVFDAESDYCGSLVLTNSGARVCFGATNSIVRLQNSSCIVVHKNHTAHLKDGGIWAVGGLQQGEIRIDGELACAGSAEIICMPGISGVENISVPNGYAKSLLTVTPDANPSAMRTVRVWVLPEGEIPTAEGQLGLGVTDSTITLPSFDMGAHALRIYAGTVQVGANAAVRAPTVQVFEGSFVAAAKIGDTYYGSFAKAVASARKDEVIELLSNVEYEMAADQVLKVRKNGHVFTHPENPGLEYNENEEDGVTTVLCATAIYTISYNVRYAGFAEFEPVADLEPDKFALSQLPLGLPRLSDETAVFHGWYWDEACAGEAMAELPENLPKIEIRLYGYFNPAVARVNGVLCETWEEAFVEQERTHYSIEIIAAHQLPDGYMNEKGTLVKVMATLQVGESMTDYSSLLEAYNASKLEDNPIIILKADAPSALTIGSDETLRVKLNGHALAVVSANPDTHIIRATLDANTGVTTYKSLLAVAKIGANYYATLSDAVANLGAADTIEILADIDSESVALPKNTTFNVQTDCTLSAILSGGHSLTKTGAGTLTINASQTLTGDFVVAEGKVEASEAVREKNADAYVEVRSGASLKFTTNVQLDCQYAFKLAGDGVKHEGALVFSALESWYNAQIKSITLAGDATITAAMSAGGVGLIGSGYSATSIELNGHTLTKKGAMPFFLYNTTVSDGSTEKTGKVVVEEGTLEIVQYPGLTYVTTFNAPVVGNLNIQAPIRVNVPANRTWTITAETIGNTASTATLAEGASLVATTGLFTSVTTDLMEKKVVKTTNASHDTYTLETKTYTVTVPSVENTTYLVQVNGEAVEIRNGTITVNHGDRVVVTYSPTESHNMTPVVKNLGIITANTTVTAENVNPTIKTFTVTAPTDTGLTVSATEVTADYSETVTITYALKTNYILKSGDLVQTFTYSSEPQQATLPVVELRSPGEVTATSFSFDVFKIGDTVVELMDGDTIIVPEDCDGDRWHPTLDNVSGRTLKVFKSMNWKTDVGHITIGSGVKVFLWNYAKIPTGALVDGEGVIVIGDNMTVTGNATIESTIYFGEQNTADTCLTLANEGATLTCRKLPDDKVVSGVDGKMVDYSEGKYKLIPIAAKIGGKPYALVQDAINALTDEQSVSDIVIVASSATIPAGYAKVTTGDIVTLRRKGDIYWTDTSTDWNLATTFATSEGGADSTKMIDGDIVHFTADKTIYTDAGVSVVKIAVKEGKVLTVGHANNGSHYNLPTGSTIELGDNAQVVFQYWGNEAVQGTATLGDITINGAKGTYSYNSNRTHPPTFGVVTGSAKLVLGEGQSVTATSFETFPISDVVHKHVVCNGTTYSLALDRFSVVIPEITGAVAKVNGETVSGSITVDYGTTITIVYEPTTGHQIGEPASVQVGPVEADIAEIDVSAIAVSKILVAVTIPEVANTTPSVEGYEIVNGVVTVPYGESITITYAANDGYQIVGDGSLVIENITENQSPAAPSMSVTYAPDRMLYCFHLDGNTDNAGLAELNTDYKITKDGSSYSCFTSTNVRFGTNAVGGGSLGSAGTYYVTAPTVGDALVDADSDWTLSMWVNYCGGATMWGNVGGFSIGENCFRIQRTNQNTFQLYCAQDMGFIGNNDASKAVPAGTTSDWRNLVFVFHASTHTLDIYSNAEKWGSVARDGFVGKALTSISMGNYVLSSIVGGTLTKEGRNYYGSAIDEVAVFNAALSANQIAWLAANKPSEDVFNVSAHPTPFGSKVIGLSDGDECQFWSDGDTIKSRVGKMYDQVVVTMLIDLPKTATAIKIVSVNEATKGGSVNKADLWWNGSKLYFGYNGGSTDENTAVPVDPGLHLVSMTVINGGVTSGNCGVNVVVDGNEAKKATRTDIRWSSNYPTGTFTYQGDIKSITLDFTTPNQETGVAPVSGLSALPKFTQKGETVEDLLTIYEILEMTGKSIGVFEDGTVPADVSLGSIVETGDANTIGITVGTSLDLPYGEVTILVEDPEVKGKFVDLSTVNPLVGPTADPTLHDAGNKLVVPINSLLNGAKSRLFKIQAKPSGGADKAGGK